MYKKNKRVFWVCLVSILILLLIGWKGNAHCQKKYPTKPINVIVSHAAGGALDIVTRMIATYLEKEWGVPVNVINKPGGFTIPGVYEVMNSAPDGYTVMADDPTTNFLLSLHKNLPFKVEDRTFLGTVAGGAMLLLTGPTSPWRTLDDVARHLRKNAEGFTWIDTGSISSTAYNQRLFFTEVGIDILKTREIFAKGGGEMVAQIMGGHVMLTSLSIPTVISPIKAGTIRALAITTKERVPQLPDVPTTKEAGYPTVNLTNWWGISGPPKMSSDTVDVWEKALYKAAHEKEMISQFEKAAIYSEYRNSKTTREEVMKRTIEAQKLWKTIN